MSYKKSRLELDSIHETSSSSPSPGTSPLNSSSGPYRGRYTRSSLGVSSSSGSSRFSPYSISRDRPSPRRSIPLIRARRDGDNSSLSSFGSTSSTAQKIMETLASMSTPVLNAGRVRIDSIKAVKPGPIGSSFMNSSGTMLSSTAKLFGPPKTSSPLLLPRTTTGVRPNADNSNWSLQCLSVPRKMVDCGTNTDECVTFNDRNPSGSNSPTKASPPKPVIKPRTVTEDEPEPVTVTRKSIIDSIINKSRSVPLSNGKFSFNKPWTLEDVDKYLASNQCKMEMKTDSSSSSDSTDQEVKNSEQLMNGDDRRLSQTNFNFNQEKTASALVDSKSAVAKKWECPTCMVNNESSDMECVCCSTPNPNAKSEPDKPGNDKKSSGAVTANVKWSCPTCMVPNEATASACVCCAEPNPNPVDKMESTSTLSSKAPIKSDFKFGFGFSGPVSTPPSDPVSNSSSGFRFGVSSENKSITDNKMSTPTASLKTPQKSEFKFGFSGPTSTTPSDSLSVSNSGSSSSGFKFGVSSENKSPIGNKVFTSTAPSKAPQKSEFKFGSSGSASSSPSEPLSVSSSASGFKYGVSSEPKSSTGNEMSTPTASLKATQKSEFKFGLSGPASSSNSDPPSVSNSSSSGFKFAISSDKSPTVNEMSTPPSLFMSAQKSNLKLGLRGPSPLAPSVPSSVGNSASSGFKFEVSSESKPTTENMSVFGIGSGKTSEDQAFVTSPAPTFSFGSSTLSTPETVQSGFNSTASLSLPVTASAPAVLRSKSPNFGFEAAAPTTTGFSFGSAAPTTTSSGFGAAAPTTTGFSFGSAAPTTTSSGFGAGAGFGFGSAAPTTTSSAFGAAAPTTTSSGFGAGADFGFGSAPPTTTSSSFGAGSPATTSFSFGANPNSSSGGVASDPTVPSTFSFASTNTNNAPASAPFQFQASSGFNPASTLNLPTTASAPAQFSVPPNFSFGAAAPTSTSFSFGANSNPGPGSGAPVPSTFSFAPTNSNNAPAPLFQFQATSGPATGTDVGGRKIRKATRRYQPRN